MKQLNKIIDTIKNIWAIEELRKKILFTLGLILVYRIGSYIVLPGINPLTITASENQNNILGLINMFSGGAFNQASIFALGVMPYISASIFMQLAGILVPQIAKLQKEESGRNKVNMYTRYLTIVVTLVQAIAYITFLKSNYAQAIVLDPTLFYVSTIFVLTAGTLFVMWLGEKITDKGIGNGVSLLIMVGIIANLPQAILQEWVTKFESDKILIFFIEIVALVLVIVALVMLNQGVRKIMLNYARKIVGNNTTKEVGGGARNFIPLKVNSVGVMPIIFAQALMFLPSMIAGFAAGEDDAPNSFVQQMSDFTSWQYNLIYAILVIAFTYFYTALTFNTTEIADNLKRNNSFIPGIQPGQPTADYIASVMDKITLPGSIFLALAGILPGLVAGLFGVSQGLAIFFGGTSMLIGVSVIIDTIQQVESHLLMKHYDGLMKTGRVSSRTTTA